MAEQPQVYQPKPAELDRQWLALNDRLLALLNRNPRKAAVVLAAMDELLPPEKPRHAADKP